MGRSRIVILLALVGAVAACSDNDESVFNAEVGECIESVSDLTGNVTSLPETSCDEPHEGEVFLLVQHEGDDDEFPGLATLEQEVRDACTGEEFEEYTGVSYEETAIDVFNLMPTEETWSQGDRESVCVLSIGEEVDESFEGNGDEFPLGTGGGASGDFDGLIEDCEDGDNAACDDLYFATPVGSEGERIGATCGGRSDDPLNGSCESTLG